MPISIPECVGRHVSEVQCAPSALTGSIYRVMSV